MTRTLDYLRRNALAALALVCSLLALGGASYAALSLPAGSVGTRQLRTGAVTNKKLANGSITPAKLDSRTIGGSVRHWAFINVNGAVIGGSRGTKASAPTQPGQPYHVSWGDQFSHSCAVLANSRELRGMVQSPTESAFTSMSPAARRSDGLSGYGRRAKTRSSTRGSTSR